MLIQELRIGNLVNSVLTDETYIIDIWALRTVEDGNYQNGHNTVKKVFKPILLTEEWLIKLGFCLLHQSCYRKVYDFEEDLRFGCEFDLKNGKLLKLTFKGNSFEHIKYVHQFQNLYFVLTGKELIIKSE